MRYLFRVKADIEEDLRKAAHCLLAAADELQRLRGKESARRTLREAMSVMPKEMQRQWEDRSEPPEDEPEVEQVRCLTCDGTGKAASRQEGSKCHVCSGTGWVIERKEGQAS